MNIRLENARTVTWLAISCLVVAIAPVSLLAQDATGQDRPFTHSYDRSSGTIYYDRTKSVPLEKSRSELEAEQLVSLSADKIISLLVSEPGLLLECKRVLVRTAFDEGRLVDREELSDDAVFQMVRDDPKVRSLFTQEIEDRYYVRAKPTREELQRNWMSGLVPTGPATPTTGNSAAAAAAASAQNQSALAKPPGQEDTYWALHSDDLYRTANPLLSPNAGVQGPSLSGGSVNPNAPNSNFQPGFNPSQSMPGGQQNSPQGPSQSYPGYDPRRALLQAQSSAAFGNYSSSGDTSAMLSSLSSNQLASLISARMSNMNGSSGEGDDSTSSSGGSLPNGFSMSGSNGGGVGSSFGNMSSGLFGAASGMNGISFGNSTGGFPLQASLNAGQPSTAFPSYGNNSFPYSTLDLDRHPPITRRPNPYADIPSLYDLYQQYSRISPTLDRFGIDVFRNGTGNFDELPMDMPVGPDYVLGPGDAVDIDLTGSVSERLGRVVDRGGRVVLPDAGSVQVAGKGLGEAQQLVQSVLRTQYRDVHVDISLSRVRTVRVYVVGDVERPGPYDVSSLSTPLNAVYEAGGPTSGGSLRVFKHYRGNQLIEQVDVYNLLLHGVPSGMQRLESGDTVLVPPLGAQVTVEGMVRRPAIYELNAEKSLAEVLEVAGGVLPSGTLRHVDVERVSAHDARSMLRLDIPENNNAADVNKALQDFQIQDGDRVKISPILPYADKTVYLEGHVFRPGKFGYYKGMKVTDLVHSYKDVLPEPYEQHAEIIRLKQPDNTPEVLTFNLGDALTGKDGGDPQLEPFDTVRIFGRFDFEDPPVVTVTGEVRDPGDHITNGATFLRDAVYLAGGTTPDALLSDVQVFRKNSDGKLQVFSVNLNKALNGDPKDNIALAAKDRIFIHRDLNKVDPPTVTIAGEVARPGKYPLGEGMTAADLVRFAGGMKRGAYTESADLTSYMVQQGSKVVSDHEEVQIAKALAGEPDADVMLHDGDVLNIRQVSDWEDLGATITVKGEVAHPGGYGIQPGERLSSILERAGGFLPNAYPYGAVFERVEVRQLQEKNRADLIQRVQAEAGQVKILPGMDTDQQVQAKAAVLQYQNTVQALQNAPPAGRLVIHVSADVRRWANTPADIQVRDGDVIYIPKRPNIILVNGAVYNPTAITFKPGRNAGWYLRQAGGATNLADKRAMFVVRADGSVVGGPAGLFSGGVQGAELQPGDTVVVPEQVYTYSTKFKTILQSAQLAAAVGVATFYFGKP